MTKRVFFIVMLALSFCVASPAQKVLPELAPATPFTYQGKLIYNGVAVTGEYDLMVEIYNAPEDGDLLDRVEVSGVRVSNGIFTVPLDISNDLFSRFDTTYIDLQVRPSGGDDFVRLTPRVRIGSAPYSGVALNARSLDCTSCIIDGQIISVSGSKVNGKVASATAADTAAFATNAQNSVVAQTALNAVDLTNTQTVGGNKTFTGIISGNGSGLVNVPGTLKWNVSTAGAVQAQSNNGYVLTNTAATTVTLPAAPAVGDVVRVMEKGSGGFTLAMNSGQSILDWATTHQETIWTRQYNVRTSSSTTYWSGIASSTDGTKLVAVQYPGIIATSTNSGQSWVERMPANVRSYTCVASSSDGTNLIAGVEGGYLYTSTDSGVNWTARMTDANRNWYSVASSSDGTRLVAADNRNVYTSTDSGVNWTARMSPNTIARVASSADGTRLVAAVLNGHVYTSTNSGLLWTDRLSSTFNQWQSVASSSDGSKIVAVESPGRIWVSSNFGVTWTSTTLGPSGINTSWSGASISSDGTRIAVSAGGTLGGSPVGLAAISYDGGGNWTPTGVGTVWLAIAVAGNGNRLSASTYDNNFNQLYTGPLTTTAIVDTITGIKDSAVELVYIGNNQFAMVSSNNMTIPPHTY